MDNYINQYMDNLVLICLCGDSIRLNRREVIKEKQSHLQKRHYGLNVPLPYHDWFSSLD